MENTIVLFWILIIIFILFSIMIFPYVYDKLDVIEEQEWIEYCVYHKYYPNKTSYEFCIDECYNLNIC